jgi:hypothetical protein
MAGVRRDVGRRETTVAASVAVATSSLLLPLLLLLSSSAARAADTFSWAPPDSPAVVRGRQVASRFDHASLWEISVEVNNAFSIENRRAITVAEEELRRVPGVRRVFGPARLADLSVDAAGKVSVRPVLNRGPGESEDEAARQRIVRRADALGWFMSPDGSRVRFLVDADDLGTLRAPLGQAIASSGLELLHADGAHLEGQALWPDPDDAAGRWLAAACSASWILLVLVVGARSQRSFGRVPRSRRLVVILAALTGAAALFALSAVPPVRGTAMRAALVAAVVAALALLQEKAAGVERARRPGLFAVARPPLGLILGAAILVAAGLTLAPGVRLGTQQWHATPFLFVSVRGDIDQPVVLREVQRLTDFLRAQPGVANAWSVADLFFGVAYAGDEPSRIPDSADMIRRVLVQARTDPAVQLELSPDHRDALVAIRFDDEAPADRLQLVDRLDRYLATDLRAALVQVDLDDGELSPVTRSVGKGLLAGDARDRIIRISARSGRSLSDVEIASVERVTRQAAVVPSADVARLKAEIAAEVRAFFRDAGVARALALDQASRNAIADELGTQSHDATLDDVRRPLVARVGVAVSDQAVSDAALALHARVARVRQRHVARISFRELLYGADLPTEGMLSDEVRSATMQAMGPVVGIPVSPALPGALHIDAMTVGGGANDRALSEYLRPGIRWGSRLGAAVIALLLLLAGRGRGLLWLPVGLAPAAVAMLVASLAGDAMGMMVLSFVGGALAGGAVLAVSIAARRMA